VLLPALLKAKERVVMLGCQGNLSLIASAFQNFGLDNNGAYPFNLSTNSAGTQELSSLDPDGFDRNSYVHFRAVSNLLNTPRILVCPADTSKTPAADWQSLRPQNVTYRMRSSTNTPSPDQVIVVCPIHGLELLGDGTIRGGRKKSGD
jgi:hypothetical protein